MEDYPNLEKFKGKSDHVIVDGKKGGLFKCLHCGASRDPQFPIDMKDMIKLIDDFVGMHANCPQQTKTLTFTGHSDDIVYVEAVSTDRNAKINGMGTEEYSLTSDDMAKFSLDNKMTIYAFYDGTWAFGVGQWEEDVPMPDWPVRFLGSKGYSAIMQVDVPVGVTITPVTE